MKVRAIAEASVKTDKVDARTLAHLLRTNLIARCHVAERGVRGVRQLLRERNNLVKARTQAINRLHNLLDRYDLRHDPQLRIGPSMPIILQMCAPKHATFV